MHQKIRHYGFFCHLVLCGLGLGSPLAAWLPKNRDNTRLPRLRRAPCKEFHPQSRHRIDEVLGVALFRSLPGSLTCTLTLLWRRIRFAYAMYHLLPVASFRPCRCQQRPCDSDCPSSRQGDTYISQAGFACHAGQTKNRMPCTRHPVLFIYNRYDTDKTMLVTESCAES